MNIIISNTDNRPIYEQISIQIKNCIINNTLKENDLLPSIRALAKNLRISVITTKRAYEELEKDGFITTVHGKGSYVASKNLEIIKEEQLKEIELHLMKAIDVARGSDIDLKEIFMYLYEGGI